MWRALKKFMYFRMGQKVSSGVARKLGLGATASLIGLIYGIRTMRRHP